MVQKNLGGDRPPANPPLVAGQDEVETSRHLFGRLSILLQKGSKQLLLARTPSHPEAHESGNPHCSRSETKHFTGVRHLKIKFTLVILAYITKKKTHFGLEIFKGFGASR